MARRENGTGNVYQRKDGLWIGRVDAGFTASGKRRRATVSAKTEAQAKRKLRELIGKLDAGNAVGIDSRMTVKRYAEQWLEVKVTQLRPKAYNAAASPIRRWIIPTIGHRRLTELTPTHIRAVERAQRDAGRKGTTAAATQRTLMNMLGDAVRDGHTIPQSVLAARKPATAASDRTDIPLADLGKILAAAANRPLGLRWLLAVLYGWRQGECLGLHRDSFDFDTGTVWLDWQLQALPYREARKPASGFRVPDDYEAKHLVDAWHLVRPKSRAGVRAAAIPAELIAPLREMVASIDNPYGLLFPAHETRKAADNGKPRTDKQDRREWWSIQDEAGVTHPTRTEPHAYYHVHECRNVAATRLRELGADDLAVTALMGHTSINTSRIYMTVQDAAQRSLVEAAWSGLAPTTSFDEP